MLIKHDAKKPSKAEAFEMIRTGEIDRDALLLFFAPAKPKKAKTPLQWVAKASDPKGVRPFLRYVCVRDRVAYGSDGHRIHWAVVDETDGLYCAQTLIKVEGYDGPDPYEALKRVIRTHTVSGDIEALVSQCETHVESTSKYHNYSKVPGGCAVVTSYLNDATNGEDCTVYSHDGHDSLIGSNSFGRFRIMRLKV